MGIVDRQLDSAEVQPMIYEQQQQQQPHMAYAGPQQPMQQSASAPSAGAPDAGVQESLQQAPFLSLAGNHEKTHLVWTAKVHAENTRLERELTALRAVAQKQRGEVKWLQDGRGQRAAADDSRSSPTCGKAPVNGRGDVAKQSVTLRLNHQLQRELDTSMEEDTLLRERALK